MAIKHEVAQAVYVMMEAHMDRRDWHAPIKTTARDFNVLLCQARDAFPHSNLLPHIDPLDAEDSFGTFFRRLVMLKTAVDSEIIGLQGT